MRISSHQQSMHTTKSLQSGFTLIEVMVSVSIFAIITTIGMSALFSLVTAQKQTQSQRAALDSLNFVIDTMGRDIRTGSHYVQSIEPGDYDDDGYNNNGVGQAFSFRDQNGCDVTYRWDNEKIQRRRPGCETHDMWKDLTNPDVVIVENLIFTVRGAEQFDHDSEQPSVGFTVQASSTFGGRTTPITLQSAVTQRLLDIPVVLSP